MSPRNPRSLLRAPSGLVLLGVLLQPTAVLASRPSARPSSRVDPPPHADVSSPSGSVPSLNVGGAAWNTVAATQGSPSKGTPPLNGLIVVYTSGDANDFPLVANGGTVVKLRPSAAAGLLACQRLTTPADTILSTATAGKCVYAIGAVPGAGYVQIFYLGAFAVGESIRYTISGLGYTAGGLGTGPIPAFDSDNPAGAPIAGPVVVAGRSPARLALVLDESPSMDWASDPFKPGCGDWVSATIANGCAPKRWQVLGRAVDAALTVVSAYALPGDQISVSPFGGMIDAVHASNLLPVNTANVAAIRTFVTGPLNAINATSIGAGLRGVTGGLENDFRPVAPTTRNQVMLLFTDGDQNRAPFVVSDGDHLLINETTNSLLGPVSEYAGPPPSGTLASVCPFALRSDALSAPLSTAFMTEIGARRCNGTSMTVSSSDPQASEMTKYFLQVLNKAVVGDKLELASVTHGQFTRQDSVGSADFVISVRDRAFTVLLTWAETSNRLRQITLEKDGKVFPVSNATPGMRVDRGAAFVAVTLQRPFVAPIGGIADGKGTWTLRMRPSFEVDTFSYNLFVDVDNETIASAFTADQPTPGVGRPIRLRATLTEGGVPLVGLPTGSLTAIVSAPGAGLGNILSAAKTALEPDPPSDPQDPASRKGRAMLKNPALRGGLISAVTATAAATVTLAETGPGVYEASFAGTGVEGVYPITFLADFQTPENARLQRTFSLTQYVKVVPDQASSLRNARVTTLLPCAQPGGCFTVTFTPRDRTGNLAGPGKSPLFFVAPTRGTLLDTVQDNLDGSYTLKVGGATPGAGGPPPISYGDVVIDVAAGGSSGLARRWELVLPFAGLTSFDNALNLDDGLVVGARLGHRLGGSLWAEAEGGVTFTKASGNSGHMVQLLGNLRYEFGSGQLRPYVTAGAGYALFRGVGTDDEAFLYHGGGGVTLNAGSHLGFRVDGRVLRIASVFGSGSTTNPQFSGGLVWRF